MEFKKSVNSKSLKSNYDKACTDPQFKKLIKHLNISDNEAMKYTSSLESTVKELHNCKECSGLIYCQNRLEGHVLFPESKGHQVIFSYAPCQYEKERKEKESNRPSRERDLENAKMSDIDVTEKGRYPIIKWLKNFYDKYERSGSYKGLYLHGNFGCGKTYLIAALFNELSKKRVSTEIVYFPELLLELKSDFDSYGDRIAYLEDVDLLLIDDIGAEKVTDWSRDEILGTILQKRMNNYKTTFFTSNLDLEGLEHHLRTTSYSDDEVKARRIIERIKHLSEDILLTGEPKRK